MNRLLLILAVTTLLAACAPAPVQSVPAWTPPATPRPTSAPWDTWSKPVLIVDDIGSVYRTDMTLFDPIHNIGGVDKEFLAYMKENVNSWGGPFLPEKYEWSGTPQLVVINSVKAWGIPSPKGITPSTSQCTWGNEWSGWRFDDTGIQQMWKASTRKYENWSAEYCDTAPVFVKALNAYYLHANGATYESGDLDLGGSLGPNFAFAEIWYARDQIEFQQP